MNSPNAKQNIFQTYDREKVGPGGSSSGRDIELAYYQNCPTTREISAI